MTLLSSNRKRGMKSHLRSYGSRHGEDFWKEESSTNNFGLTYMKKCGWKQGDGLGRERQGRDAYVKVVPKKDALGLGANEHSSDTMFKATMCLYNDILTRVGKRKKKGKKKKGGADADNAESDTKNLTATASIRKYQAKTMLWGRFAMASDITTKADEDINAVLGHSKRGGFTEADQCKLASHLSSISHKGKGGLGSKRPKQPHAADDSFGCYSTASLFGSFVSSGIIDKNDILHELADTKSKAVGGDDTKDDATESGKKKKNKKKKKKEKLKKKKKADSVDSTVSVESGSVSAKRKKKKKKRDKSKKEKSFGKKREVAEARALSEAECRREASPSLSATTVESDADIAVETQKRKKRRKRKLKQMGASDDATAMQCAADVTEHSPKKKKRKKDKKSKKSKKKRAVE